MLDALRETGWRNYSIFLREDGTLVDYLECDGFAAAQAAMQDKEVNALAVGHGALLRARVGGGARRGADVAGEIFHVD